MKVICINVNPIISPKRADDNWAEELLERIVEEVELEECIPLQQIKIPIFGS